jgi:hypothetical protein
MKKNFSPALCGQAAQLAKTGRRLPALAAQFLEAASRLKWLQEASSGIKKLWATRQKSGYGRAT